MLSKKSVVVINLLIISFLFIAVGCKTPDDSFNPVQLTINGDWAEFELESSASQFYSFEAVKDTPYLILWDDKNENPNPVSAIFSEDKENRSPNLTADIHVTAYTTKVVFFGNDAGVIDVSPKIITAEEDGEIFIEVYPIDHLDTNTGTFALRVEEWN